MKSYLEQKHPLFGQSVAPDGFVRLAAILGPHGPIPISKSAWWAGVKSGKFPQPHKLGPRTTVWHRSSIERLIADPEHWEAK